MLAVVVIAGRQRDAQRDLSLIARVDADAIVREAVSTHRDLDTKGRIVGRDIDDERLVQVLLVHDSTHEQVVLSVVLQREAQREDLRFVDAGVELLDTVTVETRVDRAQSLVDVPPGATEVQRLVADADAIDETDGRIEILLDLPRAEGAAPADTVRHA